MDEKKIVTETLTVKAVQCQMFSCGQRRVLNHTSLFTAELTSSSKVRLSSPHHRARLIGVGKRYIFDWNPWQGDSVNDAEGSKTVDPKLIEEMKRQVTSLPSSSFF